MLIRFRHSIRAKRYVLTLHAEDEMEQDGLNIFDLEHVVLTGTVIERQRDIRTDQWKYHIGGATIVGDDAEVVVRLGPTGKVLFITVYRV